jgi:hypothetical protein
MRMVFGRNECGSKAGQRLFSRHCDVGPVRYVVIFQDFHCCSVIYNSYCVWNWKYVFFLQSPIRDTASRSML